MTDGVARVRYRSALTDNGAWDRFALRPDDVVVTTPPKCGTTWTQSLTLCLIFGRPGMDREVDDHSVWLDPGFRDQEAIGARFAAQTHRRCIKTHTPVDGIPVLPDCRYVAVCHPLDAHFSMRRHQENMKFDLFDGRFDPDDSAGTFARFLEDPPANEMGDGVTLTSIVHHFRSMRAVASQPNVLPMHYADMTRDLAGETARLARFLGYDYSQASLAEIAASQSFGRVKANARARTRFSAQASATFQDPAAFFDSGSGRKWEGKLSEAEFATYRRKLAALLPPREALWLEEGGPLPAD